MTWAKPPLGGSLAQRRGRRHQYLFWVGGLIRNQESIGFVLLLIHQCSLPSESRAQKITEARRVGAPR